MRILLVTAGVLMAVPVAAQQPSQAGAARVARSGDLQVSDLVCKLSGECPTASIGVPTPTMAAPQTKSFRIANGPGSVPVASAPAGRVTRFVRAPSPTDLRRGRTPRLGAAMTPRYTAPRPSVAPGTATVPGRANLLLTFGYNSARLTPGAEANARTFAEALMMPQLKDKRFLIEGHTDARGSRTLNMDLSRRRAQAVADFLFAQGIDRTRVQVSGVGPDEPLPGLSAKAEANRRVEAVVVS